MRVSLCGAGALGGFVLLAGGASLWRPAWYRPAAVEYNFLDADKRELVALYDRISADLNAGRICEFEITAAQLNRWLAAHEKFWPALDDAFSELVDPQVRFQEGARVQIAATVDAGGWPAVAAIDVELTTPARIVATVRGAQVGSLPLPVGWLWAFAAERIRATDAQRVEVEDQAVTLFNEWVWENGRVPFRVSGFETSAVLATIRLEPLRRDAARPGASSRTSGL